MNEECIEHQKMVQTKLKQIDDLKTENEKVVAQN